MWLTVALAATALLAGHATLLRYRGEANEFAAVQARWAAEATANYVAEVLIASTAGELPDVESYTAEDLSIGGCRVWILGRSDDPEATEPTFGLQDENGLLNLNTAEPEMIAALPGMSDELAAAIVDWRDVDDDISANGAESETYLALDPPYVAKNAPFETVGELRLLNGAEIAMLDGIDRNRNGLLEEWEKTLAEASTERFAEVPDNGIAHLVTTLSQEPNLTEDGEPRVNLNQDPQAVRAVLVELYGDERGGQLAAQIQGLEFTSVLQFCMRTNLIGDDAAKAFDRFTAVEEALIRGRINLNTAPLAVLATLPGVREDGAESLIAWREQNPDELDTPLWLAFTAPFDGVDLIGHYVTTKSYQIVADIVAVAPHGRAFCRLRIVFDTSTGTPVVVDRRDLTHLGWPLGQALYDELHRPTGVSP